jgi:hypothetical protein
LHGWPDEHQARASLTRTCADPGVHHAAPALSSASCGIYLCDGDAGLWHTTVMSRAEWRRLVQPIELALPQPPYLPPRHRTTALPAYLTTVGQLLTDAITHAPAGLALPPRAALCARYRVPGSWVRDFHTTHVRDGLLRCHRQLYLTNGHRPPPTTP